MAQDLITGSTGGATPSALREARVVILGGTSGLGYAVAAAAVRDGAAVVVASSRPAQVDAAVASLSALADDARVEGHVADLSDEPSVRDLFARVGAFDHLVYTAGEAIRLGEVADTDLAAARRYLDVRVWGAFAAVKYGAAHLRPGGSVVLTSGTAGRRPRRGWALGAMLCSAMEGLTRALAMELAPVRVNAVCPGVVRTPLWREMPEDDREAMYRSIGAALPVGRVGEPGDVAAAYTFLMRAAYTTGQIVVVDGGATLV